MSRYLALVSVALLLVGTVGCARTLPAQGPVSTAASPDDVVSQAVRLAGLEPAVADSARITGYVVAFAVTEYDQGVEGANTYVDVLVDKDGKLLGLRRADGSSPMLPLASRIAAQDEIPLAAQARRRFARAAAAYLAVRPPDPASHAEFSAADGRVLGYLVSMPDPDTEGKDLKVVIGSDGYYFGPTSVWQPPTAEERAKGAEEASRTLAAYFQATEAGDRKAQLDTLTPLMRTAAAQDPGMPKGRLIRAEDAGRGARQRYLGELVGTEGLTEQDVIVFDVDYNETAGTGTKRARFTLVREAASPWLIDRVVP